MGQPSQFSLAALFGWITSLALLFGTVRVCMSLAESGTIFTDPEYGTLPFLCMALWISGLLAVSVGLPISFLQVAWADHKPLGQHLQLRAGSLTYGAFIGALTGNSLVWLTTQLVKAMDLSDFPYESDAIAAAFGALLGSTAGALGGGLPKTRQGFLGAALGSQIPTMMVLWLLGFGRFTSDFPFAALLWLCITLVTLASIGTTRVLLHVWYEVSERPSARPTKFPRDKRKLEAKQNFSARPRRTDP